jgi:hypothetical protein
MDVSIVLTSLKVEYVPLFLNNSKSSLPQYGFVSTIKRLFKYFFDRLNAADNLDRKRKLSGSELIRLLWVSKWVRQVNSFGRKTGVELRSN